jgi:protein SCO1/2
MPPRLLTVLVPLCALAGLAGCSSRRLPYDGKVPDFSLTSQTGRKITLADLMGKIWVADTFYTTCPGPCPMMSSRMSTVAKETAYLGNVRIVSLSVDPEHDTPAVLLAYAQRYHANPDRWFFLTGPRLDLNHVSLDGLHLSVVDGTLDHNVKFALVDAHALVRGYYNPFDHKDMTQLGADIRSLAGS